MSPRVQPRPAATIIIARDHREGGIEVLMMRRSQRLEFGGGNYVFPGGALEAADGDAAWNSLCDGQDDASASRLLELDQGGLAYWVAAVRECFEEAGLLLCREASGAFLGSAATGNAERLDRLRSELSASGKSFAGLLAEHQWRPALDEMGYLSHWITPPGRSRRYDVRFFVTTAPLQQQASHDGEEAVALEWLQPQAALQRATAGAINMTLPTVKTLESLARFADGKSLMQWVRSPRDIPAILGRKANARDGQRTLRPGEAAYAEVAKLDPEETGEVSCEIIPGIPTRLSPRVRRLTAPNPGHMTGPGTNAYLIGAGNELAIIDPGPAIPEHVEALLAEAKRDGGRVRWLLVTHTHNDHSPTAALLRERTGARLIGRPPPEHGNQDRSFAPDHVPADGERLDIAGCTLRAVHTPGHASNQVIYLLEEERLLFTGDHVMQGSTVVISPPDGNMIHYLASLRVAQELEADWIAPGHGFLIDQPRKAIDRIIRHRLAREAKVLKALNEREGGTVEELVPLVYDDVPAKIHPVASRSLHAHLIKLQGEGRVVLSGARWTAVPVQTI